MRHPCAVLIFDRKATNADRSVVFRPCGAPSNQVVTISRDHLFAVCFRHNARLERDGIKAV